MYQLVRISILSNETCMILDPIALMLYRNSLFIKSLCPSICSCFNVVVISLYFSCPLRRGWDMCYNMCISIVDI